MPADRARAIAEGQLKMELNEIAIVNASLIPWDETGVLKSAVVAIPTL